MTSHLSVRFFCNAQQEEKRETQEESLQHAYNNNNTRPKKQRIYVSWNIETDHVLSREKESGYSSGLIPTFARQTAE